MSDKNNFEVRFAYNIVPKVINTYKNKKHVYAINVSQKHYENDVCKNSDSFILYDELHESREAAREFLSDFFKWAGDYKDFLDENGKVIDNDSFGTLEHILKGLMRSRQTKHFSQISGMPAIALLHRLS